MSVNTCSQVLYMASNVTRDSPSFNRRPVCTHVHPPPTTLYVPPSRVCCPSSRSATSRPHKDTSSAGRCPTRDKVSPPHPHESHSDLPLCPVKPAPFAPPLGQSSLPPVYLVSGAAHPRH